MIIFKHIFYLTSFAFSSIQLYMGVNSKAMKLSALCIVMSLYHVRQCAILLKVILYAGFSSVVFPNDNAFTKCIIN